MIRLLYQIGRADFLERTRRYSFLITLAITAYVGYTFVPPPDAHYLTVALGTHRGVYNSAWMGSTVALMTSAFLSLAGFYLVKGAVDRDRTTRVGQILATTRMSSALYTVGKTLSNLAVLSAIVLVLAVVALVMQLVRGEDMQVRLWPLLSPFLLITLPWLAFVAALAVLFETISWLRGGFGNVAYFFLWMSILATGAMTTSLFGTWQALADPLGVSVPLNSMIESCKRVYPDYKETDVNIGYSILEKERIATTFRWEGVEWSAGILLARFAWLVAGALLALIAAFFFDRFNPSRESARVKRLSPENGGVDPAEEIPPPSRHSHLSPLHPEAKAFHLSRMVAAEIRLALKGRSRWWYIVSAGLLIACLAAPANISRQWILPFAWIWPITILSSLGCREEQHETGLLVFSSPGALWRQFPASLLAGIAVMVLTGCGTAIGNIRGGDWMSLAAWVTGALFVPSMALALGVWSGSSKLFEVLYTLLWYIGPMNQVPFLDFMGATSAAGDQGYFLYYLASSAFLIACAFGGRRRQMRLCA